MNSIFIFSFKLDDGHISSWPVYAPTYRQAYQKFDSRLAGFGLEREKYKTLSCREIPENKVQIGLHARQIQRLTPEDRKQFFIDRKNRQQKKRGKVEISVAEFFQIKRELATR